MFLHGAHGKPFPQHYLDQAVTTYLDTCRSVSRRTRTGECLIWALGDCVTGFVCGNVALNLGNVSLCGLERTDRF